MTDKTGWRIERYINNDIYYWSGRLFNTSSHRHRGYERGQEWAVCFAREEDAMQVLVHVLNGEGRVAEHVLCAKPQEGG